MNRIYFGDNLRILRSLHDETVDLIYIDPPFNTGKTQKHTKIKAVKSKNGSRVGFKGNTYQTIELGTKAYQDSFEFSSQGLGSRASSLELAYKSLAPNASIYYLEDFLRPRLLEARRVLKPHGSLYFHIDYREVHYCKILLDQVFGRECFLNEIIWAYDYGGRARSKWPAKHDNILFYVKDPKNYIFNTGAIDRESYKAPNLVGSEKAKRGKLPTDTWFPEYVGTKGKESDSWWLSYLSKGTNSAIWQTIVPTGSKERVGYPTQKPRGLIDRIIKASSLPGNVVLDFFAGSGTVGESCLELNRSFILIDNNKEALEVMAQRFSKVENIKWVNYKPKPHQKKTVIKDIEKKNKTPKISQEFLLLATTASYIQKDLQENSDYWKDSPFEWVLQLPARKKGKLGRQLLSPWLASKGILVESSKDTSETLIIKGHRVAIKFSTMWGKGFYRFQQIRSVGYDYVICLGIAPLEAHCWIFPREHIIRYATQQHKGSNEYWIPIYPNNPPDWAKGWGGSMDDVFKIIKKLGSK